MKIHCLYDKLVKLKDLKPHPKNRNKHGADQIARLAKILDYQGWRYPVKVSKLSGHVTSGHGRIMAAELNKWDKIPVNFQDYENEEQEYADVQADNAIASWAELDMAGINGDLENLGPDFDLEMLGIKDFVLEPADKFQDENKPLNLSDRFLIPPFSVINAREGWWQARKKQWIAMGIKSELGRGGGDSSSPISGKTLGAIPPNQKDIMKRKGKYA
jgi:hypothetical protein